MQVCSALLKTSPVLALNISFSSVSDILGETEGQCGWSTVSRGEGTEELRVIKGRDPTRIFGVWIIFQ